MGEMNPETLTGNDSYFMWAVFIVATLLMQIAFLNMLVAIISNTFTDVMENKLMSEMKERIKVVTEFWFLTKCLNVDKQF